MRTPVRMSFEHFQTVKEIWAKEFVGGLALAQLQEELTDPFLMQVLPMICIKCGTSIMALDAYVSIHITEFGENCAGSGDVERIPIPFCPKCEPEPNLYGCLHVPLDQDDMRMAN